MKLSKNIMSNYFQELPLDITFIICSYLKSNDILLILNLISDLLDRAKTTIERVFLKLIALYDTTIDYTLIIDPVIVYDVLFDSGWEYKMNHEQLLMLAGVQSDNFYADFYQYKDCQYMNKCEQSDNFYADFYQYKDCQYMNKCGQETVFYKYCFDHLRESKPLLELNKRGLSYDVLDTLIGSILDKNE